MRLVAVKRQLAPAVSAQDESPLFEQGGQSVAAVLQPMSGSVDAAVYGEQAAHMLLMLTQSDMPFEPGMGVCVDGADGACDYRVAAPPEKWRGHTRLALKRI